LVEGIFAVVEAQKIQGLLDEPVAYLRILAKPAGKGLLTGSQRAGLFADQQARGYPGLAPSPVHSISNRFHALKLIQPGSFDNPGESGRIQ
jgi:hypothetical protein